MLPPKRKYISLCHGTFYFRKCLNFSWKFPLFPGLLLKRGFEATYPQRQNTHEAPTIRKMPPSNLVHSLGTQGRDILLWDKEDNLIIRDVDAFSSLDSHVAQFCLGFSIEVCRFPPPPPLWGRCQHVRELSAR